MKVQWRVALCCAVMFIGWISAEEANKRKLIIRVPHVHHKHPPRPPLKAHSSHGKGHSKPGEHIHKHHHHFHDDNYGESSHGHEYEDHGHHHGHHHSHHRSPSHHHHPHHPHSHSHHRHHSSPSHYHSDHHGYGSHHVTHHKHPGHHHKHPDHHHDDDYVHRYRSEDSKYEDHYPEYSHHHYRPHHYAEDDDDEYDCMEVCEKCKMKSYHRRHRVGPSRGHDIMRAESEIRPSLPHPLLTVANFKPSSSSPTVVRGNYDVKGKEEFKPSLATGELRDTPSAYRGNKYGGYVLPTAIEQAVASNAGKVITTNGPIRHGEHPTEFDASFPTFPSSDFLPTGNWQNNSYFYENFKDPVQNIVGYNQQRQEMQHTRYVEEGTHHVENNNNDGRGRDLRYLNRYKYDIKR